jgi:peptidoglycan/LPS O-acetylase OafA/YrhL
MLAFWSKEQNIQTAIYHSPLFVLYNGYASVYIFFVLSGLVLTFAFSHDIDQPLKLVVSRYVRLAIPAFAACILALFVTTLVGTPNVATGKITGSDNWLQVLWHMPSGVSFFLKDAVLNAVFLGYQQTATWTMLGLPVTLDDIHSSYVSPMWTLSAEFHGSLLVLLWTILHKRNHNAWRIVVIASLGFFAFTHFLCFAIGHLIAIQIKNNRLPTLCWPLGAVIILIGCVICTGAQSWTTINFNDICKLTAATHMPCTSNYQQTIGAMLIFLGVILCAPIVRLLQAKSLVYLGRLSFSIYLVHWPVVMGVTPSIFLLIKDTTGELIAKLLCSVLTLIITLLVAIPFSKIDQLAIALSRKIKHTQLPQRRQLDREIIGVNADSATDEV